MCGSTRVTTSPSSSSTRRSTPCAAGCCGPKLMVKLRTASDMSVARLRERGEDFGAGHVLGVVCEGVVVGLLVDEDLLRERKAVPIVERLHRDEHGRLADQP